MRRLLVVLLIASSCVAQVQGNRPEIIDATNGISLAQTNNNVLALAEGANTGDLIDVCVASFDGSGLTYGVTDTLGNTYTLTGGTQTPRNGSTKGLIYHAYTISGSSGADTITVAQPSPSTVTIMLGASRYSGLGAVDGAVAAATEDQNPAGGMGSMSTTQTTSTNGDLLSTCAAAGTFNQDGNITPSTNAEYNLWGGGGGGTNVFMSHYHAGAAGSQTVTLNTYAGHAFGLTDTFAMQTLAFKPATTIQITDTVLPDAGSGTAYFAQLHCVGGTAAITYSLFSGSLPTGLSLNTTTGQITGTTSSVGTSSLGFRCTDGTVTSATATLSLKVAASLTTATIGSVSASLVDPNGPGWQSVSVSCGDLVVVFARGTDTHYFDGWVQMANGVGNYISDTFNSTRRRLEGWTPGAIAAPFSVFILGPMTTSGTDTINFANSQKASSANPVSLVWVVHNGEIIDPAVGLSTMTNSSSGTFGTSYTTLVSNTLLLQGIFLGSSEFNPPWPALSLAAPWSTDYAGNNPSTTDNTVSLYASATAATPQTVSATVSYTSGSTSSSPWAQIIVPVRPAPPPSCNVSSGPGEKITDFAY